jgi:hypothetical protein
MQRSFCCTLHEISTWEHDLFLHNCFPLLTDLIFLIWIVCIAHLEVYLWLEFALFRMYSLMRPQEVQLLDDYTCIQNGTAGLLFESKLFQLAFDLVLPREEILLKHCWYLSRYLFIWQRKSVNMEIYFVYVSKTKQGRNLYSIVKINIQPSSFH